MFRRLTLLAFVAVGLLPCTSSAGIHISRNNPFRSFNTSGVNYGSMRWEQQQQKKPVQRYQSGYRYGVRLW